MVGSKVSRSGKPRGGKLKSLLYGGSRVVLGDEERKVEWEEEFELLMDEMEQEGANQIRKKAKRYSEVYRQISGRSVIDNSHKGLFSMVASRMGMDGDRIASKVDDLEDREIKVFDFMFDIIEKMIQTMMELEDRVRVDAVDAESRSELLAMHTAEFRRRMKEGIGVHIEEMAMRNGMDLSFGEGMSDEEREAKMAQLEKLKEELDIDGIEEHISSTYKNEAIIFANKVIDSSKALHDLGPKTRDLLFDMLIAGEYYILPFIYEDTYGIDIWRQYEVFKEIESNHNNPQKSLYIGRQRSMTSVEIIERFSKYISAEQKAEIIRCSGYGYSSSNRSKHVGLLESLKHLNTKLYFATEDQVQTAEREEAGVFEIDDDIIDFSNESDVDSDINGSSYGKYMTTESYFRTYKKIGILRIKEGDSFTERRVNENILTSELKKEFNIKEFTSVAIFDMDYEKYENSLVWDYEEEIRYGVKIQFPTLGESNGNMYLCGDVVPVRMSDGSDKYGLNMPVCGYVNGISIAKKVINYQNLHDYAITEMWETLEKNQGIITMFNPKYFASLFEDMNDEDDRAAMMNTYLSAVKEIGALRTEMDPQQGITSQPLNVLNASSVGEAMNFWNMAQQFKVEALQKLEIVSKEIKREQNGQEYKDVGTTTVVESVYDRFNDGMMRFHETFIEYSKYAVFNGIDKYDLLNMTIQDKSYLSIESLAKTNNRKIKVLPVSDSSGRRMLNMLKSKVMQNTSLLSIEDTAKYLKADSVQEIVNMSKGIEEKKSELTQLQARIDQERAGKEHANKLDLIAAKGKIDIHLKEIDKEVKLKTAVYTPLGFQKTEEGMDKIMELNKEITEEYDNQIDGLIKQKRQDLDRIVSTKQDENKSKELDLKAEELQIRKDKMNNDLVIADMNKN